MLHKIYPQSNAFQRTKEEFGGIDIVCNNAGIGNEDKWKMTLDVNLVCPQSLNLIGHYSPDSSLA